MSESFDKAVEAASEAIAGQYWRTAMDDARAALRAALPHLTAQDVPHLIREAKAEAWDEGRDEALAAWKVNYYDPHQWIDPNPYAEEADHDHA